LKHVKFQIIAGLVILSLVAVYFYFFLRLPEYVGFGGKTVEFSECFPRKFETTEGSFINEEGIIGLRSYEWNWWEKKETSCRGKYEMISYEFDGSNYFTVHLNESRDNEIFLSYEGEDADFVYYSGRLVTRRFNLDRRLNLTKSGWSPITVGNESIDNYAIGLFMHGTNQYVFLEDLNDGSPFIELRNGTYYVGYSIEPGENLKFRVWLVNEI